MKKLPVIILLLLGSGCSEQQESLPKAEQQINCTASDFLNLANMATETSFFHQRDSVLRSQYPHGDKDTFNTVDITREMLRQFLSEINIDSLALSGSIEKVYFFNISPPAYSDSKLCEDKITIQYFEDDCTYRMTIDTIYMVEGDCIGGSQVSYGFRIEGDKIVDFTRQEAG